jgi:hypothetical protein
VSSRRRASRGLRVRARPRSAIVRWSRRGTGRSPGRRGTNPRPVACCPLSALGAHCARTRSPRRNRRGQEQRCDRRRAGPHKTRGREAHELDLREARAARVRRHRPTGECDAPSPRRTRSSPTTRFRRPLNTRGPATLNGRAGAEYPASQRRRSRGTRAQGHAPRRSRTKGWPCRPSGGGPAGVRAAEGL